MEITCLKLGAKRKMLKNHFRFFIVGALPFFTISLLTILNYYFINQIKKTNFGFSDFSSPYTEKIRLTLIVFFILFSFMVWKTVSLCSQNYFYNMAKGNKASFIKTIKNLSFSQYISFLGVTIIKALLSLFVCTVYFLPCIAVSCLLVYCYRYESYGYNVNLTLFVSALILLFTGTVFIFITLKRYAFSTYVILTNNERNPLKIITKSIEIMENKSVSYSLYCLSFTGWVLSCIFIIPAFYTIPYINLSKWQYVHYTVKKQKQTRKNEKPIIFYIQKRVEN